MPASERTPLLSNNPNSLNNDIAGSSRPNSLNSGITLHEEANHLILHLKSPSTIFYSPNSDSELATYLYALHILDPKRSIQHTSIRSRIAESELGRKLREKIYDKVEDLLDCGCHIPEDDVEGDERLQEIFWRRWRVKKGGERWVNVTELLLPPFTPKSYTSPFLSHPTVRHVLELTWLRNISRSSLKEGNNGNVVFRIYNKLSKIVTHSRLHLLDLFSFLILYGLSLSIALSPKERISPYEPSSNDAALSAKEIVWMIWAGSILIHSLQHSTSPTRRILLLPVHLSFIFSLFPSFGQIAYTLLLISISTITFSLVLPEAPSIPILIPGLLPLSVLLQRVLTRSIKTAGLLMPIVLALFLLFSWSMNGDIFRGFYQLSTIPISNFHTQHPSLNHEIHINPEKMYIQAEPIEDGISPFSARLTLFITLSLLFIFSLLLTASRSILIPKERWDDESEKRWKGAIKEGDFWEKEYGLIVGRGAREGWCRAVRMYMWDLNEQGDAKGSSRDEESLDTSQGDRNIHVDRQTTSNGGSTNKHSQPNDDMRSSPEPTSPKIPPPLDLITVPLDILEHIPSRRLSEKVNQAKYILSMFIVGLICLPIFFISRFFTFVFAVEG